MTLRYLGISPQLRALAKNLFRFPFYWILFPFFTLLWRFQEARFPANTWQQYPCWIREAWWGIRERTPPKGCPRPQQEWVIVKGSPPCVLILRNIELNVNTLPLLRALTSEHWEWGNAMPGCSSEGKTGIICSKSLAKKWVFLDLSYLGRKTYRRTFGISPPVLMMGRSWVANKRGPIS